MNAPQLQWESQRAFLAVLRTGSLSGAARVLGIRRPPHVGVSRPWSKAWG